MSLEIESVFYIDGCIFIFDKVNDFIDLGKLPYTSSIPNSKKPSQKYKCLQITPISYKNRDLMGAPKAKVVGYFLNVQKLSYFSLYAGPT